MTVKINILYKKGMNLMQHKDTSWLPLPIIYYLFSYYIHVKYTFRIMIPFLPHLLFWKKGQQGNFENYLWTDRPLGYY